MTDQTGCGNRGLKTGIFLCLCLLGSHAFALGTAECLRLNLSSISQIQPPSPENLVQNKIIPAIQKSDADLLSKIFHTRLNVSEIKMSTLLKNFRQSVGELRDVSIYRAWEIHIPKSDSADVNCPEDGIHFVTHYGYPKQYVFWLQAMASEELGRIYFTLIEQPKKGWRIGAWHSHQWTHMQKDSQEWFASARSDLAKQQKELAYLKADLASRLLDGGGQFLLDSQKQMLTFRDQIFLADDWVKHIDRMMPAREEFALTEANSEFGGQGLGILLKFRDEDKPRPTASYREFCRKSLSVVYKHLATKELGDGACAFLPRQKIPTEDVSHWATYRVSQADL